MYFFELKKMLKSYTKEPLISKEKSITVELYKAQPDLVTFYKLTNWYLTGEALLALLWTAQMIVFKVYWEYPQYRVLSLTFLFHFVSPVAMYGVIQQAQNNNSVSWWVFFYFFIGLAADTESILEVFIGPVYRNLYWAWQFSVATAILNSAFTLIGISLYVYWFIIVKPPSVSIPAAVQQYRLKN